MAASNITGSYTTSTKHPGGRPSGPVNTISGSGRQTNNTISGGSGNTQYNATHQHFHGTQVSGQDQLNEDFRKTLFLSSPEIDRNNLIDIKEGRVSNTCEWIRTTKEYKAFLQGTQRLLWIWGEPGKGKTMLSIFISQDLELEKETKTIYFFCRAEHEKRNNAVAVLRGLLWHLTGLCPELTRVLRKKCGPAVKDALSSREKLWISFKEIVVAVKSEQLYCIIDGLDECDESSQQWLAKKFVSLHNDADTSSCSVVVLSRYLVELKDMHQVNLDSDYKEQVRSDVKVFVEARTEELFQRITLSDTHRNELRERLFEGAQGSFLWVGFAMIDLLRQKNENGVMRALGRLPAGLFPLYDRMLKDIEPDSQEISLCILRYVALAYRPLTLGELAFVASSRSARSGPPITTLNIRDLTEGCGPLFRIKEDIVTLVHESARDYTKEAVFPDGFGLKPQETHSRFAWACIDALRLSQGSLEEIFGFYARPKPLRPLTRYAVDFWPHHAREADRLAQELISHPSSFFDTNSELRTEWWRNSFGAGTYRQETVCPAILHLACFLGIKPWARDVLKKCKPLSPRQRRVTGSSVVERDHNGWTALHWAAFGGQEVTVELLLDQMADINAEDCHGMTALDWAAYRHREATVRLLLRRKVNFDARHLGGWTSLHRGAKKGHTIIVKLLLDYGANVNAIGNFGRTALHFAAKEGHLAMVGLLLDHKAFVDIRDEYGRTPLHHVANKEAIVKLLLEHGADANAKDDSNTTVLHMAAYYGSDAAVRLLLRHGANSNAINDDGRTVLHYAFEWTNLNPNYVQFEATVMLLLEYRADINAKDRKGKTALAELLEACSNPVLDPGWSIWHYGMEGCDREEKIQRAIRVLARHGAQMSAGERERVMHKQFDPEVVASLDLASISPAVALRKYY
jgi:ankyrin repeat protein